MPLTGRKYSLLEDAGGVELEYATEKIIDGEDCAFSAAGYDSDNVKEALQEGASTAIAIGRFSLPLIYNGNVSDGDKITYSNLTPGTKIVIPVTGELEEITWSNSKVAVAFDLELRKNIQTGTPFNTLSVVDTDGDNGFFNGLTESFTEGDYIDIEYVDNGTNAQDLVLVIFVRTIV